jgi:hypothetical protein
MQPTQPTQTKQPLHYQFYKPKTEKSSSIFTISKTVKFARFIFPDLSIQQEVSLIIALFEIKWFFKEKKTQIIQTVTLVAFASIAFFHLSQRANDDPATH